MKEYAKQNGVQSRTFISNGSSLQFKDNINRSDIIQKIAWIKNRPLSFLPTFGNSYLNSGLIYSRACHRHIIFKKQQPELNNVDRKYKNNVGYHCVDGITNGRGSRFSEDVDNFNYLEDQEISRSSDQDKLLVEAVNETPGNENYNIRSYNCKHWVNDVVEKFKIKKNNLKRSRR